MFHLTQKRFEFTIVETRTYTIVGEGNSQFEAEQDAIAKFHKYPVRATKTGPPRAIKARPIR